MTFGPGDPGSGGTPPADPGQPARGAGETGPRHGYGRASVPNQGFDGRRHPEQSPAGTTYGGAPQRHVGVHHGGTHGGTHSAGTAPVGAFHERPAPYGSPTRVGPATESRRGSPDAPASNRPGAPTRRSLRATRRGRLMGTLAVAALVVVLGYGGYIAFFSTSDGTSAAAGPRAHDITSQRADPAPLTPAEVFPGTAVTATTGGQAYRLVKSQQAADCGTAVVGDISSLLSAAGCTQVVRATLLSADQTYVITAGIFNLRDADGAKQAADGIQVSLSATRGRFTGYPVGGISDVIQRAPTQLGWDVQGHFLVYAVVAKADGTQIADAASVRPTIQDLVEKYLMGKVIHARTLAVAAPSGKSTKSGKK